MDSVTVVTKLARVGDAISTRDTDTLNRLFQIMQREALQTPTKATERLFVRVYNLSSRKNQPTFEQ
jgi:hypothetical protein